MKLPDPKQASLLTKLGIHPVLAVIILMTDLALSGGEVASAGVSLWISVPVSILLGFFSILWQWIGSKDPFKWAFLKGAAIAVLTAIPTPLASILPVLGAVLPLLNSTKKVNSSDQFADVSADDTDDAPTEISPGGRPMRRAKGRDITQD